MSLREHILNKVKALVARFPGISPLERKKGFCGLLREIAKMQHATDIDRSLLEAHDHQFMPLLRELQELGAIMPVKSGVRIVRYRIDWTYFAEGVLEDHFDRTQSPRGRPPRQKEEVGETEPAEVVRTKAERNKSPKSIALIVDFPNFNSLNSIRPEDINWAALKARLSIYHGTSILVARAILCVNEIYYQAHRSAFLAAEKHFKIRKMQGNKDVDPVVSSEIISVILDHLLKLKNDRIPVINLVSGDKDFSWVLETLRPYVEDAGMKLELLITTWENGSSRALTDPAQQVTYIDDLIPLITR